jgi:hypothetical protein
LGRIQYLTAKENPPHLTCICPSVAGSQYDYLEYYPGGCLRTEYVDQLDNLGYGTSTFVLAHQTRDIVWQVTESANLYPASIQVPAFMIGGWYDHNVDAMITLFDELQQNGAPSVAAAHKMLFGPWTHGGHGTSSVGGPGQGQMNHPNAVGWNDSLALRFFDYYLRNIANGWPNEPAMRYYMPGQETWHTTPSWPPANQQGIYYFGAQGKLKNTPPSISTDTQRTIAYDPRNPSPTVGGPTLRSDLDQGPYDQAPLVESRNDVIIFSTDTLKEPLTIAGKPSVILYVKSNRPDTDFAIRVTDVFPDGRSMLLLDGVRRMRFRSSYSNPDTIIPGNVYQITVDLPHLAYTWNIGHKIRVDVTSSNYPRFDSNLNNGDAMYTAGDTLTASNTLYYSPFRPSRLILPIKTVATSVKTPLETEESFQVFPNPAQQWVQVKWQGMQATEIRLQDAMGRTIRRTTANNSAGQWELAVADLPQGMYYMTLIQADGKQTTRQMIIAR